MFYRGSLQIWWKLVGGRVKVVWYPDGYRRKNVAVSVHGTWEMAVAPVKT